jgi:hypothetical protein
MRGRVSLEWNRTNDVDNPFDAASLEVVSSTVCESSVKMASQPRLKLPSSYIKQSLFVEPPEQLQALAHAFAASLQAVMPEQPWDAQTLFDRLVFYRGCAWVSAQKLSDENRGGKAYARRREMLRGVLESLFAVSSDAWPPGVEDVVEPLALELWVNPIVPPPSVRASSRRL